MWPFKSKRDRIIEVINQIKLSVSEFEQILFDIKNHPEDNDVLRDKLKLLIQQINQLKNINYTLLTKESLSENAFSFNPEFCDDQEQISSLYDTTAGFILNLDKTREALIALVSNLSGINSTFSRGASAHSENLENARQQLIQRIELLINSLITDLKDAFSGNNSLLCGIKVERSRNITKKRKGKTLFTILALAGALGGLGMKANIIQPREQYSRVMQSYMEHLKKEKLDPALLKKIKNDGMEVHFYPGEKTMQVVDPVTNEVLIELTARGGPNEKYQDPRHPEHWYGPTHQGKFTIIKDIKPYINRASSWKGARIKFGALIREEGNEIQVSENEGKTWFFVTGPKSKVSGFTKDDFYVVGILISRWYANPFGHITIEFMDEKGKVSPEKIHTNTFGEFTQMAPEGLGHLIQPISHGCIHMSPSDIEVLKELVLATKTDFKVIFIVHSYSETPKLTT